MADLKTRQTELSPEAFLAAVEDPVRRADAQAVSAMMARLSGEQPAMWGPSIVGFGSYHYRYDSGHEGDMARVSFSPRKAELVLYVTGGFPGYDALIARLGKHRMGKSCLYIRKLADVDQAVLEQLIRESLAHMDATYPR